MAPEWVYRWLPGLRARELERQQLRETVETLTQDKLRLQDQLIAAQEDRSRLWDLVKDSLAGERTAYQMHVNMTVQKQGAGIPYPDAPHYAPQAVPQPPNGETVGRKGRVLPSDVIHQQTESFIGSWFARDRA